MVLFDIKAIVLGLIKSFYWCSGRYPLSLIRTSNKALNRKGDQSFITAFRNIQIGYYTSVMNAIKHNQKIKHYRTCNLFLPDDIKPGSSQDTYLKNLDDPSFKAYKARLQILKKERIMKWWIEWKKMRQKAHLEADIVAFAEYASQKIFEFKDQYGRTFDNFWLTHDEKLIEEGVYYGEYVILNNNIVIRYDIDTKLLEIIKHKNLVGDYNLCFTSLTQIKTYKDLKATPHDEVKAFIKRQVKNWIHELMDVMDAG